MSNVTITPLLLSTNTDLQNRICLGTATTSFDFQMETKPSFTETATYSVTGLPSGVLATFASPSQSVAGTNNIIISNLATLQPGEYSFTVTGTTASASSNLFFKIVIQNAFSNVPLLDFPVNNASQVDTNPSFIWESMGPNVTSYVIEIAKDPNFSSSFQTFTSQTNQLDVTNLDFGTQYFWHVKATNLCGESSFSETFIFSTPCSNDIVITISNQTINGATATWTNPNAASSFEILVVPQGAAPTGTYTTVNSNSYTFSTLNSYSSYDIYLRSSCSGNTFSTLISKQFSTLVNHCADGVFFDSGNATGNYGNGEYITTTMNPINTGDQVSVTFTFFNLENGADNLKIFNGPDINSPFITEEYGFTGTNSPGTVTSTHPTGKLTFLFYSDGVVTAPGWTANVSCANLKTISAIKNSFSYYPNPTSGIIKFSGFETIKSITAYSMIGQLLKSEKVNAKENTFDISDFPAGNYLFKVETESATKTVEIMKQ
jgi:Secretion system C-terminal sorting domain